MSEQEPQEEAIDVQAEARRLRTLSLEDLQAQVEALAEEMTEQEKRLAMKGAQIEPLVWMAVRLRMITLMLWPNDTHMPLILEHLSMLESRRILDHAEKGLATHRLLEGVPQQVPQNIVPTGFMSRRERRDAKFGRH